MCPISCPDTLSCALVLTCNFAYVCPTSCPDMLPCTLVLTRLPRILIRVLLCAHMYVHTHMSRIRRRVCTCVPTRVPPHTFSATDTRPYTVSRCVLTQTYPPIPSTRTRTLNTRPLTDLVPPDPYTPSHTHTPSHYVLAVRALTPHIHTHLPHTPPTVHTLSHDIRIYTDTPTHVTVRPSIRVR